MAHSRRRFSTSQLKACIMWNHCWVLTPVSLELLSLPLPARHPKSNACCKNRWSTIPPKKKTWHQKHAMRHAETKSGNLSPPSWITKKKKFSAKNWWGMSWKRKKRFEIQICRTLSGCAEREENDTFVIIVGSLFFGISISIKSPASRKSECRCWNVKNPPDRAKQN